MSTLTVASNNPSFLSDHDIHKPFIHSFDLSNVGNVVERYLSSDEMNSLKRENILPLLFNGENDFLLEERFFLLYGFDHLKEDYVSDTLTIPQEYLSGETGLLKMEKLERMGHSHFNLFKALSAFLIRHAFIDYNKNSSDNPYLFKAYSDLEYKILSRTITCHAFYGNPCSQSYFGLHADPSIVIMVVIDGEKEIKVVLEDKEYLIQLKPGDFLVLDDQVKHQVTHYCQSDMLSIGLEIPLKERLTS